MAFSWNFYCCYSISSLLLLLLSQPFKHQFHKMVERTQTVRRQIADELFDIQTIRGIGAFDHFVGLALKGLRDVTGQMIKYLSVDELFIISFKLHLFYLLNKYTCFTKDLLYLQRAKNSETKETLKRVKEFQVPLRRVTIFTSNDCFCR